MEFMSKFSRGMILATCSDRPRGIPFLDSTTLDSCLHPLPRYPSSVMSNLESKNVSFSPNYYIDFCIETLFQLKVVSWLLIPDNLINECHSSQQRP